MRNYTTKSINFSPLGRKKVIGSFSGGTITSDGGLLLLREADKKFGVTRNLSKLIIDRRNPLYIIHSQTTLLKQRIYAIAANYEDINDHDHLRTDIAFQTVLNQEKDLASSATLSRFENRVTRADCARMSQNLVEHFIQMHKIVPQELVLDFDPTDYRLWAC